MFLSPSMKVGWDQRETADKPWIPWDGSPLPVLQCLMQSSVLEKILAVKQASLGFS